jgi:hypothetical protein
VLRKCANPVCHVPFRYLHQGKLVEVEIQYREGPCGSGNSWLCDWCVACVVLQFDRRRGIVLMSSLGESTEIATTSILQFHPRGGMDIARVLIRPSDLTLTPSTGEELQAS